MTTPRFTATVRRYNGTSGEREIERKIRIPLTIYLESFAELWPFHRKALAGDRLLVDVYSTADRFASHQPDYIFTINPINA